MILSPSSNGRIDLFVFVQKFDCEICGNYSYWGRRAFERHFKESRHQHGMRCLGIPNTKFFNEITSIQVKLLLIICYCYPLFYTFSNVLIINRRQGIYGRKYKKSKG